jgi:hypothetical protein
MLIDVYGLMGWLGASRRGEMEDEGEAASKLLLSSLAQKRA